MSEAPTSTKNVYKRFIEELNALRINANDPAAHVVGELTRAVKRAQMVVDGELKPLSESDGGSRLTTPFDIRNIERADD